ncbi:UNVERIFIED_CONTAM: hypothetical protein FKN15_018312 [Acipenser sinensis]
MPGKALPSLLGYRRATPVGGTSYWEISFQYVLKIKHTNTVPAVYGPLFSVACYI